MNRLVLLALAALLALGSLCLALNGCGSNTTLGTAVVRPLMPLLGDEPAFHFFSPQSFWNTPPPTSAPLDPNSKALVARLQGEVETELAAGNGPWINTTDYSVPVYRVGADEPTQHVHLTSRFAAQPLRSAWRAVPLPANARPSEGSDHALVVWQPQTDRLWEFWRLQHEPTGWTAAWGGAMEAVSSNPGVYGPGAWAGADRWWGSSASSLSIAGGLITFDDLQRGWINHALAIAVPEARAAIYASPAQRTDGTSQSPAALPEGAHLRLDPNLDLSTLHLPKLTWMIAKAAQRFGIFVRDKARVTQFFAQDPQPAGADPYLGAAGYFAGETPSELLASFPWNRLQVLAMDLHRFSPETGTG
jgi:hypothetical protein